MNRRTRIAVGITLTGLVVVGIAGRSQMLRMRARFEGRQPDLDVMRQRPADLGLQYESFNATNPDGTRIAGWWVPAESALGSILMVHGFGGNKSTMLSRAVTFVETGFNVALIDLRARGESGGERADLGPGAADDVLAAADALRSSGRVSILPLIGYGLSHGARSVLLAAVKSRSGFAAIIAEAPPFSLREGLKRATGLPWVPPLPEGDLAATFETLREQPTLLLLGDRDPEISVEQAKSFLSGNIHPASSVEVFRNTGHGVFSTDNREEYRRRTATFLATAIKARGFSPSRSM